MSAPDGSEHSVRIEWVGNRLRRAPSELRRRVRRQGRRGEDAANVADGCVPLDLDEIAVIALALALLAAVWFLVLPAAWGVLELIVVLLFAAVVWAVRVLFRRPWTIVHRDAQEEPIERCLVVGWRRAHATMVEAADEVASTGSAHATFAARAPFS